MVDYDCKLCKDYNTEVNCYHCEDGSKFKKINNFEKIRNMSIEEMADFASHYVSCGYCDARQPYGNCGKTCKERLLNWLQSEAE